MKKFEIKTHVGFTERHILNGETSVFLKTEQGMQWLDNFLIEQLYITQKLMKVSSGLYFLDSNFLLHFPEDCSLYFTSKDNGILTEYLEEEVFLICDHCKIKNLWISKLVMGPNAQEWVHINGIIECNIMLKL